MGAASFPHRNSPPFARGVWCGVMKMQYHKKCCKEFENSQKKIRDEDNYKDDKEDDDVDEYVFDENGDNDDVSNVSAH
jgi:hypothetical protein